MTKTCPSCGSQTATDARFCRRCGAPVRMSGDDGGDSVSPIANTVPLRDDGRATDGLAPEDPRRPGPDTSRVNRAELDSLLRAPTRQSQPFDPNVTTPYIDPSTLNGEQPPPTPPQHIPRQSGNFDSTVPYFSGDSTTPYFEPVGGNGDDGDEELTITVSRPLPQQQSSAPFGYQAEQQPNAAGASSQHAPSSLAQPFVAQPSTTQPPAQPPHARPSRARYVWFAVAAGSLFLLLLTAVAVWLGIGYFRKPAPAQVSNATELPAADASKQRLEEKLAEAESLLASGDLDSAIARLREATAIDPSNSGVRRRLGDILLDNGRRREAIEEFRAITTQDPRDAEAWRSLARAQLDESLYAEAVASYRRLTGLTGESGLTDNELLSYAEALRLSGDTDAARPLYERLSSSAFTEVAAAARRHISEMSASTLPTPSASPDAARNPGDEQQQQARNRTPQASASPALSAPTPAPPAPTPPPLPAPTAPTVQQSALSASDHFQRGEQMWASNRAAAIGEFRAAVGKGNRDAYYYLGLSIVEGRNPKTLPRPELLQALQYFQNARSGRFRSQAQRYEELLGKEYDRLRNQ